MTVRKSDLISIARNIGMGVLFVACFVVVMLIVVVLVPILIVVALCCYLKEAWFLTRLRWQRRRLRWSDARIHLLTGDGTFLLEVDRVGGSIHRVWWLPERVGKLCPTAPWSTYTELLRWPVGTTALFELPPQTEYWFERHLALLAPRALLVDSTAQNARSILNSSPRQNSVLVTIYPAVSQRAQRRRQFRGLLTGRLYRLPI